MSPERTLVLVCLCLAAPLAIAAEPPIQPFSAAEPGALPAGWHVEGIRGRPKTAYTAVTDGDRVVIQADAEKSTAGLVFDTRFSPTEWPVLQWGWKISEHLAGTDILRKKGDDFPARVYVSFDYDKRRLPVGKRFQLGLAQLIFGADLPGASICYVWDRNLRIDTILPSAYTDRVQMIVVRSGDAGVDTWVSETRNLVDDYRAAFGEEPPDVVAISIATDTDDSGDSTRSWFGDIELARK
ncbi:MAG: DUF3047 domain-containing protein [Gammaproteobacteria bacterium]|nr:DUF3047 domain-containing protein [Gammaproteobacteria bacterium]